MKLNLYDILAKIIPGGIIFWGLWVWLNAKGLPAEIGKISEVTHLIMMYFIGFIIDAIGSFFLNFWLLTFIFGLPAVRLLKGKSFLGIKIDHLDRLTEHYQKKYGEIASNKEAEAFNNIHSLVRKDNERLQTFFESYIGARNILISAIGAGIFILLAHWSWSLLLIVILIVSVVWVRMIERNYYFVKDVYAQYWAQFVSPEKPDTKAEDPD